MFIKDAVKRLNDLMQFLRFKAKQEYDLKRGQLKQITPEEEKISENVLFTEQTEMKFFKLINVLVKNSEQNMKLLKLLKQPLNDYLYQIVAMNISKAADDPEMYKHYDEVKDRIRNLLARID